MPESDSGIDHDTSVHDLNLKPVHLPLALPGASLDRNRRAASRPLPTYFRRVVKNCVQKRVVDLDLAVIADEAELAEFVHEEADAGTGGADHLRQCFLAHLNLDRMQAAFLAEVGQQQQKPRQPLLARIEKLVDQVRFDSVVARQQVRHEEFGEARLVMEGREHRGLRDGGDHAVFQRRGGGKPERLAVQAPFAEELTGLKNPDDRLLALFGQHDNLHPALLDVENLVCRVSLREHALGLAEGRHGLALSDLREEGLRIKFASGSLYQRSAPAWPSACIAITNIMSDGAHIIDLSQAGDVVGSVQLGDHRRQPLILSAVLREPHRNSRTCRNYRLPIAGLFATVVFGWLLFIAGIAGLVATLRA